MSRNLYVFVPFYPAIDSEDASFLVPRTTTRPILRHSSDLEGKAVILLSTFIPQSLLPEPDISASEGTKSTQSSQCKRLNFCHHSMVLMHVASGIFFRRPICISRPSFRCLCHSWTWKTHRMRFACGLCSR
jgi:hypothetical protein